MASPSSPRLLIPITMVWVARNVVHSGLLKQLAAAGVEPVVLVPQDPPEEVAQRLDADGVTTVPLLSAESRATRFDWFINAVLNFANVRRCAPATYRLRRRWYERHYPGKTRLRNQAAAALSALFVGRRSHERLRRTWERRTISSFDLNHVIDQMKELRCTAVWANNWGMGAEAPYTAAAKELGIPAVASIISFDNVLTKGIRPSFQRYLVWSERVAAELLASDPRISRERISVVGTPQFDFHRRPDLLWDRATTLERLGLAEGSRYLLYGAGREYHSPGEIDLVESIGRHLAEDPRLARHRMVVRLHPLDRADRWREREREREGGVTLCEPFTPPVNGGGWSWSSLDDQALLVSSLYHADACLSVASTIALDAAIVGTPAIGLRLDQGEDVPGEVYFDAFDLDHYRPLCESGGLWVAHSWPELSTLLARAVEHPEDGKEERERMVGDICGPVDGQAGERAVRELTAFVGGCRREACA
jgi:hypothetical protein